MRPVSLKLTLWLADAAWRVAVAPVRAAVQLDGTSSAEDATDMLTWTHTGRSGNDRGLVVGVSVRRSSTTADTVTYGGVSMTARLSAPRPARPASRSR